MSSTANMVDTDVSFSLTLSCSNFGKNERSRINTFFHDVKFQDGQKSGLCWAAEQNSSKDSSALTDTVHNHWSQ